MLIGVFLPGALSPASADSCPGPTCLTVIVRYDNGRQLPSQTFSMDDIASSAYDLFDKDDGFAYTFDKGVSIYSVLTNLVGPAASGVKRVIVREGTANSQTYELSRPWQLADPTSSVATSHYRNGWAPVFFYYVTGGNQTMAFGLPKEQSESGPNIVRFGSQASRFTMTVYATTPGYVPQATAETTTTAVGKPVRLGVAYADDRRPKSPTKYIWDFGDGQVIGDCATSVLDSRASLTHQWRGPGTYGVRLGVCGAGQKYPVRSTPVFVTVGPKPSPTSGPSGGSGDGKNGPATGPKTGNGSNAGGSTTSGRGDTSGLSGSGGGAGSAAARAAAQAAAEARRALGGPSAGLTSVQGVVLAADTARPLAMPESGASAPLAAAASRRPGEIPKDWRWLLGLLPVVLLAGGVARQSRWLAPRFPQPPWRAT